MKTKNIILTVLGVGIGLLCDWALIHNFFWQTSMNVYYQRYIWVYEAVSWISFVGLIIIMISLGLYKSSASYRQKSTENIKETVAAHKPRLWKSIYLWVISIPSIIFAGVFVGDISLAVVWTLCVILGQAVQSMAQDVQKIIDETEALEAAMKAADQSEK